MIEDHFAIRIKSKSDLRLLLVLDTTFLDFTPLSGKLKINDPDIGYHNFDTGVGFGLHVALLFDRKTNLPLGLGGAQILVRPFSHINKPKIHYKKRAAADRESSKWNNLIQSSRSRIDTSVELTVVGDREADIYPLICQIRALTNVSYVIRMAHNRKIKDSEHGKLIDLIDSQHVLGVYKAEVKPQASRRARMACMEVRSVSTTLVCPPGETKNVDPAVLGTVETSVVCVREVNPPKGEKPLSWILLTNLPVNTLEDCIQIVDDYRHRWLIEETFRILKSEGLDVESTQLETGHALQKLVLVALVNAVKLLGLRQGRNFTERGSIFEHFDPVEIEVLRAILPRVEGKKGAQLNPHPNDSLAWAVWILGRLGGWTPGNASRPPGTKTLSHGYREFSAMVRGVKLIRNMQESR
jgi:hypothetical protein